MLVYSLTHIAEANNTAILSLLPGHTPQHSPRAIEGGSYPTDFSVAGIGPEFRRNWRTQQALGAMPEQRRRRRIQKEEELYLIEYIKLYRRI